MQVEVRNLLKDALAIPFEHELSAYEISALRDMTAGIVPYFIAFTARSGSTFLTHEISAASVLSRPEEWFNYSNAKKSEFKGSCAFSDYFKTALNASSPHHGIFGCEINWLQLTALSTIVDPQELFEEKIRWFYLRRRNVVSQAISLYFADKTGVFHSYQSTEASKVRIEELMYDADAIKKQVREFVRQEKCFNQWFSDINVTPVSIFYEDVIRCPRDSVMLFANVLGVKLENNFGKIGSQNPIKKIGGEKNAEFENRFRKEEAEFIIEQSYVRGQIMNCTNTL